MDPRDVCYKTHQTTPVGSRSDDHDALNSGRYNAAFKTRALIDDRWSAHPRNRRADFQGAADSTHDIAPRGLQLKQLCGT